MPIKSYKNKKQLTMNVAEPAIAYQKVNSEISSSNKWNPDIPFHGTQDEWWEHFHNIEKGNFTPLDKANIEFEAWKKSYLANRLK